MKEEKDCSMFIWLGGIILLVVIICIAIIKNSNNTSITYFKKGKETHVIDIDENMNFLGYAWDGNDLIIHFVNE